MEKNDLVYLRHIIDAIDKIEEYLSGVSEEDFIASSSFKMALSDS